MPPFDFWQGGAYLSLAGDPSVAAGRLAQLAEHLVYTERVGGSIPSPPTIFRKINALAFGFRWWDIEGSRCLAQSHLLGDLAPWCLLLRWPVPRDVHPKQRPSSIKVSLRTRDPKQALSLARHSGYEAQLLLAHGAVCGMKFDEIRSLLAEHFRQRLSVAKGEIAERGRLGRNDRTALESTAYFAQEALTEGRPHHPGGDDDDWMRRLIERYDLSIEPGTAEYENLRTETIRAHRDYCNALLEYDRSLDRYELISDAAAGVRWDRQICGNRQNC
jgi:hypothetical protein